MFSWKVQNPNKLLSEVKRRCPEQYSGKDLKWSIEHNRCFINNHLENFPSATLQIGDHIFFSPEKRPFFKVEEERIFYEDSSLMVYSKPPNLTSEELAQLSQCHLVHRLDRDTTGIILLAKTEEAKVHLIDQFRKKEVRKEYLAIVLGHPGKGGSICERMAPISRREGAVFWGIRSDGLISKTVWQTRETLGKYSLIHCMPITGRTHQIRVHFKHLGFPLVGDYTYGSPFRVPNIFRPLLHAHSLCFKHPITTLPLTFVSPPPPDFIT